MSKKKINRIIASIVIFLLVLFSFYYLISKYSKDDNSLSVVEKKWISNNLNTIIDVDIYNDVPLYAYDGSGICFDFLDSFSKKYNINFSKKSYYQNEDVSYGDLSFKVIKSQEKLKKHDIVFASDNYVVVSKNKNLASLDNLNNVATLEEDQELLKNYFSNNPTIRAYATTDDIVKALDNKEVEYAIMPNIMNMRKILSNNLNIVYHLSDLNNKYVLHAKNKTVYEIMKKYYNIYLKKNYDDDYSHEFLSTYFASTHTKDVERKNYNSKIYKYGYVINMPYENYANSKFVGTISNYLSAFEKISNTEIEVTRYDNIDDLKNALISGEVDFSLTNFDYEKLNLKNITTLSFKNEDYVVLNKENIPISTLKGLKARKISVIGSSNLYYLCNSLGLPTKLFSNTDDLIRNINNGDTIILDKETYIYYKDAKLKDYKIIYENSLNNTYKFILNQESETFAKMLNYYISSQDYNQIRYNYNTDIMIAEDNKNLEIVTLIVIVIIITILFLLLINKKKGNSFNLSRDDMLRYIDPMTSLKNRTYLNYNIYNWDDNVIFPQSIIVFDINKLKDINDTYGREMGDEVIKKVASILINNQLENTDIIRSDGDEFLIYMIGYDKEQVVSYAKKLSREMRTISDSFGVEYGYSMILDEIKTVDDAINESITMMQKNKEKNR